MYLLVLSDVLLSILAVYSGYAIRFSRIPLSEFVFGLGGIKLFVFASVLFLSSFMVELYKKDKNTEKKEVILRIITALILAFFIQTSLYYLFPMMMIGRGILALSLGIFGFLQFIAHIAYYKSLNISRYARRVLILGTGPLAKQMGWIISSMKQNYVLAGYVNCSSNESVYVPQNMIIGDWSGLVEIARKERAHEIIVSLSERRGIFPIKDVLNCKLSGIEVVDAPSFYERATGKLMIENITPSWLIFSQGFKITAIRMFYKRIFDVVFSILAIVCAAPLILVIAVAIKLDSRGSVFYKQERVGQQEKLFTVFKFRTMRTDAEKETGAVWAQENDSRVTRVGRFLRRFRLDEIPQFYNVIIGDMSLVGPRPERLKFVEELKEAIPFYSERHFAKPGITGWAQIKYPYGASMEDSLEKLRYDLFYIKNSDILLDQKIIYETVKIVLFGRGGR